ncbi:MAG: serine/threonine protein kinase [Methanosarcinales archaeon]|nr:serine/threonine protein kinase [Methanosarcinales archaeon]
MIDDVLRFFRTLDSKDLRILTGIEIGMKNYEWVPLEEIRKYTKLSFEQLEYRLFKLFKSKIVVGTKSPYEGYQIYFDGYDALALNTFLKRGTVSAIGDEIGVGKESVVHEAIQEPELAIANPIPVIIKFHREGRTSFKRVKRVRDHLADREHFSWIYAARLAAKREYDIMQTLYGKISIPKPLDYNRHAIVMAPAKGSILVKTRLLEPEWVLDEILSQIKIVYSEGIIHSDLSEYNIFVSDEGVEFIDWPQYVTVEHPHADELLERDVFNVLTHFRRKYNMDKDMDEVISQIKASV